MRTYNLIICRDFETLVLHIAYEEDNETWDYANSEEFRGKLNEMQLEDYDVLNFETLYEVNDFLLEVAEGINGLRPAR